MKTFRITFLIVVALVSVSIGIKKINQKFESLEKQSIQAAKTNEKLAADITALQNRPIPSPIIQKEVEVIFVKPQLTAEKAASLWEAEQRKNKTVKIKPKKTTLTEKEFDSFISGIKHWEGFREKRYVCSGGKVTIGYGFTGKELKGRYRISKEAAERQLVQEIIPEYGKIVDRVVKVPLTKHQRLALISFAYNLGEKPLRKLVNGKGRLNDGNYQSVARILPLYRKAKGKVLEGLELRRQWELCVWEGEIHDEYGN